MLKKHTTYYWNNLELPFDTETEPEFEFTSEDGKIIIAGFLIRDDCPSDPIEDYDEGEFYQFSSCSIHYTPRPDADEFKRIICEYPGRVFTVACYEHSNVSYTISQGPFYPADVKGKKNNQRAQDIIDDASGYYIVPADVTDARRYAEGVLESYSNWCNGEVYGVSIWKWIDGEFVEDSRDSECWGFNGYQYAKEELERIFNEEVKNHERQN